MLLDDGERARAETYLVPEDRNAFVAAHGLLRAVLASHAKTAGAVLRFKAGTTGKPELVQAEGDVPVAFSLSHARSIVACVVAPIGPVGIDVEPVPSAPYETAFLEACFTDGERAQLRSLTSRELPLAYTELWTMKESALKALGAGLTLGLDRVECRLDPPGIVHQPDPSRPLVASVYRPHAHCVLAVARPVAHRDRYPIALREVYAGDSAPLAALNSPCTV